MGRRMVDGSFSESGDGTQSREQPQRQHGLIGQRHTLGGDRPSRQGLGLHQLRVATEAAVGRGSRLSYAERGAKDNPWIEAFWGRFETESGGLILDAETLEEVGTILGEQLDYYNRERRH